MATTQHIITRALRRIRVVGMIEDTPSEYSAVALDAFNDMISGWENGLQTVTRTFTGDTTSGGYQITGIEEPLEVYSAYDIPLKSNISGTGIASGATVVQINSVSELKMSAVATASGTAVSLTFNVVPFDDSLTEALISTLALRMTDEFGVTPTASLVAAATQGQAEIDGALMYVPRRNVLDRALVRVPSSRYYDGVGTDGSE